MKTHTVAGTVTTDGPQPLSAASVVVSSGPSQIATTVTAADGTYGVEVPTRGVYQVTPVAPGMMFSPPPRQYVDLDEDVTGQDFHGLALGLSGNAFVMKSDGTTLTFPTLSGVTVVVEGQLSSGAGSQVAATDANGAYAFKGLIVGQTYTLTATLDGYDLVAGQSATVTIAQPATVHDFYFRQSSDSDDTWLIVGAFAVSTFLSTVSVFATLSSAPWFQALAVRIGSYVASKVGSGATAEEVGTELQGMTAADAAGSGAALPSSVADTSVAALAASPADASVVSGTLMTAAANMEAMTTAQTILQSTTPAQMLQLLNEVPQAQLPDVVINLLANRSSSFTTQLTDLASTLRSNGLLTAEPADMALPTGVDGTVSFGDMVGQAATAAANETGFSISSDADAWAGVDELGIDAVADGLPDAIAVLLDVGLAALV